MHQDHLSCFWSKLPLTLFKAFGKFHQAPVKHCLGNRYKKVRLGNTNMLFYSKPFVFMLQSRHRFCKKSIAKQVSVFQGHVNEALVIFSSRAEVSKTFHVNLAKFKVISPYSFFKFFNLPGGQNFVLFTLLWLQLLVKKNTTNVLQMRI